MDSHCLFQQTDFQREVDGFRWPVSRTMLSHAGGEDPLLDALTEETLGTRLSARENPSWFVRTFRATPAPASVKMISTFGETQPVQFVTRPAMPPVT